MAKGIPDSFVPDAPASFIPDDEAPASFIPDEDPSFIQKAGEFGLSAITEIPILAEGKQIAIKKARSILDETRPSFLKTPDTTNPLVLAAVTVRNSLIPMPTGDLVAGALELGVPTSPIELVGQFATPFLGPLFKALKANRVIKPKVFPIEPPNHKSVQPYLRIQKLLRQWQRIRYTEIRNSYKPPTHLIHQLPGCLR